MNSAAISASDVFFEKSTCFENRIYLLTSKLRYKACLCTVELRHDKGRAFIDWFSLHGSPASEESECTH